MVEICIIVAGTANNQNSSFQINDTKLYVPVVTLSTQENIKLLKQLESGFKRTFNWNKYLRLMMVEKVPSNLTALEVKD